MRGQGWRAAARQKKTYTDPRWPILHGSTLKRVGIIPIRLDDDSSMIKMGSKADWYARRVGGRRRALAHSSCVNT